MHKRNVPEQFTKQCTRETHEIFRAQERERDNFTGYSWETTSYTYIYIYIKGVRLWDDSCVRVEIGDWGKARDT